MGLKETKGPSTKYGCATDVLSLVLKAYGPRPNFPESESLLSLTQPDLSPLWLTSYPMVRCGKNLHSQKLPAITQNPTGEYSNTAARVHSKLSELSLIFLEQPREDWRLSVESWVAAQLFLCPSWESPTLMFLSCCPNTRRPTPRRDNSTRSCHWRGMEDGDTSHLCVPHL